MSQKNNQIYSTHTAEVKAEGLAKGESKKSKEIAHNLLKHGIGISILPT